MVIGDADGGQYPADMVEWRGEGECDTVVKESRKMGDIDGDGTVTGKCCPIPSCQNNPSYGMSPPCDPAFGADPGPAGDAGATAVVSVEYGGLGCGEWAGGGAPDPQNCPVFYFIDIDGNGELGDLWDTACPGAHYDGTVEPYLVEGQCCAASGPCQGVCVGEVCEYDPNDF